MKKKWSLTRKQTIFVWCAMIPCLIAILLFSIFPIIQTFYGSLFNWNALTGQMTFIGIDNFKNAFSDQLVGKSLFNTIYLTFFAVLLKTILAFAVALMVNATKRAQGFYRAIYFLPTICTMIATAFVFRFLLQPEAGTINGYLQMLGISGPGWLEDPVWAMPTVILYTIWKDFGYVFLIFLAGIQGISPEVVEASVIDGATGFQRVRYIIVPLMHPITIYNVVTQVIGSLQIFTSIIGLTNNAATSTAGGPMYATTTTGLYIYQMAFTNYKFGYASAIAVILFAIIMIFTCVQMKFADRKGEF